jgi:hypothetical protein
MAVYDPARMIVDRGDNRLHSYPGFQAQNACYGYQTANALAAGYGRWGNGHFAWLS